MNIPKAIEIGDTHQAGFILTPAVDLRNAIKLLIEAGKRIEDGRSKGYDYFGHLLPGETEE